ncbi:MAG: tetratricopeptide repeat protein [Nitrospirota bacterium]
MNRHLLNIFLVVILGLFSYANTFHIPFHFDDKSKIVENHDIRDLDYFAEFLKGKPVSHRYIPERRIAAYLTFALNYKLNGLNVTGYHIVNLTIHIINAILVYVLLVFAFGLTMTGRTHSKSSSSSIGKEENVGKLIALFSALLFVSHPLQTQAVTYIVQRLSSLTTLFYLFSLVMYIQSRQTTEDVSSQESGGSVFSGKNLFFYSLSVVSAVLAMKTKEIAFTLPVVITIYEFIFFKEKAGRRILYLIPLLLTMVIIPLSMTDLEKPVGELISDAAEKTIVQTSMSRLTYLYTQCRVIVTYIGLLFLPVNQSLLYEYPRYHTFFNAAVYLSFLFHSALLGIGAYILYFLRKKTASGVYNETSLSCLRLVSFGIFWFYITLSVESSVIPIIDVINEHRVYLASPGFFIMTVSFTFYLANQFRDRWHGSVKMVTTVFMVAVIVLSFVSSRRNTVWQDEITLWSDVVQKHPGHPTALNNLGEAYASRGQVDKAVIYFNRVIARYPNHPEAYSNLSVAYAGKGQIDKAIEYSERAINIYPDFSKGYSNLGVLYIRKGQPDKAIEYLKKAITLAPRLAKVHYNLGYSYYLKGLLDEAIEAYLKAVKLKPDYARAHYDLGVAFREKGMTDEAGNHLRRAQELQKK